MPRTQALSLGRQNSFHTHTKQQVKLEYQVLGPVRRFETCRKELPSPRSPWKLVDRL
jgi:hypothetical protein